MKIGVYGGSFNPIHNMHQEIVDKLLELHYVDKVIILPTGNYYKKSNLLKGEERMKMLELAFKDNDKVIICDYEFKNNLISTYRSLDYLQHCYPQDTLYFVMGADNLLGFDKWKNYEYILDNYNLLIIDRDLDYSKQLNEFSSYKGEIKIAKDVVTSSISSSFIRDSIYNDNALMCKDCLDNRVYKYIIEKGFYKKGYKEEINQTYLDDKSFLSEYKNNVYEKMSITTDIVLFSVSDI